MKEEAKSVDAEGLIEALFDSGSRPTVRWVRNLQTRRAIPVVKIGGLVRFRVTDVRKAIDENYTILPRNNKRESR